MFSDKDLSEKDFVKQDLNYNCTTGNRHVVKKGAVMSSDQKFLWLHFAIKYIKTSTLVSIQIKTVFKEY